jgi:hypothetical protein
MAVVIHNTWRNGAMGSPNGTTTVVDFSSDDIRWNLIDATDLSSPADPPVATWDDGADMDQATPVAVGTQLQNPTVGTVAVGVFDCDPFTFGSVSGDDADYLSLRKYDATAVNLTLIITLDSDVTGIPVSPNGGDIIVTPHASGIVQV